MQALNFQDRIGEVLEDDEEVEVANLFEDSKPFNSWITLLI